MGALKRFFRWLFSPSARLPVVVLLLIGLAGMANQVWAEFRANNSANCRTCHDPLAFASQSNRAQRSHKKFFTGESTCIDCHQGVAHKEPEEPAAPAKTSMAQ